MKKTAQAGHIISYIPIKKQFTSKDLYKNITRSAHRRELIFEEFIKFVKAQQFNIREHYTKLKDRDNLIFNELISDAFDMISQCWGQEMIRMCNQRVKSIQDFLHNPQFKQNLSSQCTQNQGVKFQQMQQQLFQHVKEQQNQISVFLETAQQYANDRQKTLNYFNLNYLKQPLAELTKLYELIRSSDNNIKKLVIRLESKKIKFLSAFKKFRRIASNNRILYQEKFYKICNIMIDTLIKTFTSQLRELNEIKYTLKNSEKNIPQQRLKQLNELTIQNLFSISSSLKHLSNTIFNIIKGCTDQSFKFNRKIRQILKVQQTIPSNALNFIIQTFQKMLGRYRQISNNLHQKAKILQLQQSKISDSSSTNTSNLQSHIKRPKSCLIQKTATTSKLIYQIIDQMIDPIQKLVTWTQTSLTKQRQTILGKNYKNSITNIVVDGFQEKIHEQDMWMFKDLNSSKQTKIFEISKLKQKLQELNQISNNLKKPEGKQVMEPQKCQLSISSSYDKKGIFYTYDSCVKFISSQDSYIMVVPYQSIQKVKVKLQTFKMNLFLYTSRGRICFINPPRALKCKQKISERIKNSNQNKEDDETNELDTKVGNQPKWKSIQITTGQLQKMQQRKSKILKQIPDTSDWSQIHPNYSFKNITIDQFFFEFFSDNSKQIAGKKWESFNVYLLNMLGGNSNIQSGKLSPKGPKFYTQQEGETFQSCVSYSERTNNFQHALQNMPIPFMPKSCKCKQVSKIYWVSNEQFVYELNAYTSGVSITQTFYVKMIQYYKKNGSNVDATYKATVVFVKDTSLKSVLQKKCLQQLKQNLAKTLKFQQNRTKIVTNIGDDQTTQQQTESLNPQISVIKSSSSQYNILLIFGGVIIFLIIIKLLKIMIL